MRTPTCIYADSKYSIKRHGGVIKCNAAKVYLAAYSYGEEKMESLFDISNESNAYAPLADRMRPEILDDIICQTTIVEIGPCGFTHLGRHQEGMVELVGF